MYDDRNNMHDDTNSMLGDTNVLLDDINIRLDDINITLMTPMMHTKRQVACTKTNRLDDDTNGTWTQMKRNLDDGTDIETTEQTQGMTC